MRKWKRIRLGEAARFEVVVAAADRKAEVALARVSNAEEAMRAAIERAEEAETEAKVCGSRVEAEKASKHEAAVAAREAQAAAIAAAVEQSVKEAEKENEHLSGQCREMHEVIKRMSTQAEAREAKVCGGDRRRGRERRGERREGAV